MKKFILLLSLIGAICIHEAIVLVDRPLSPWQQRSDLKKIKRKWWQSEPLEAMLKTNSGFKIKENQLKKVIYYPDSDTLVIFYLDK